MYKGPTYNVEEISCSGGKITFRVDVTPPNSFVHVYFRTLNDYLSKMYFENDHISVARRHEQAIQTFKKVVEAICDCPVQARRTKKFEEEQLLLKVQALKSENTKYDLPGGKHVIQK